METILGISASLDATIEILSKASKIVTAVESHRAGLNMPFITCNVTGENYDTQKNGFKSVEGIFLHLVLYQSDTQCNSAFDI